jgi:hypothetical protein
MFIGAAGAGVLALLLVVVSGRVRRSTGGSSAERAEDDDPLPLAAGAGVVRRSTGGCSASGSGPLPVLRPEEYAGCSETRGGGVAAKVMLVTSPTG